MHSAEVGIPDWFRAHGSPVFQGLIKQIPSDFKVDEVLDIDFSGDGEHDWLRVEKTNANTRWVARELAKHAGVAERDVGFAGRKDRRAVTTQWFSVRRPTGAGTDWSSLALEGVQVLQETRHSAKLKRGAHRGNRFRLLVRNVPADGSALDARLTAIDRLGVPNYFGLQRFGRDGGNLRLAARLFAGKRLSRDKRGLAISAARSLLFNNVLSARVEAATWNRILPGEAVNLDGSGSHFLADDTDEDLEMRCASFDVHPTGPLWGRGTPACGPDVTAFERSICEARGDFIEGLDAQGVRMSRRALRLPVRNLNWTHTGRELDIRFQLGKGGYATAVMRELLG